MLPSDLLRDGGEHIAGRDKSVQAGPVDAGIQRRLKSRRVGPEEATDSGIGVR